MAFLGNRTVNLLNLHYGIHCLALSGGSAFFAVYLLKAGLPAPEVLAALACIYLVRFLIRPIVIPAASRYGLRALVTAGTLLSAVQYPFLAAVDGVGPMLYAFVLVAAAGETIYWTTYHAYFARAGDDAHRGHQIGAREAVAAIVGIVSPLLTGGLLVAFGPAVAFGFNAAVTIVSALPLFWAPDVPVARTAPGAIRAAWPGVRLFSSDGWIAASYLFVWQIALFISLGEDFLAFGGALALAALAGAIAGLFLGRLIDSGHGTRAVWIGCGTLAAIAAFRSVATDAAWAAVIANALGALGSCLYIPTLMTAVYTQAKSAPCALRFHVALEGGWDAGVASGLLLSAALAWAGLPLETIILLSLLGVAAGAAMLRRYYARRPVLAVEPILPEPAIVP